MNLIERLSLKHSIFLAPMAGVSTPELAAEVSNAGALGSLGLGANTVEQARKQILKTQQLTRQPFQLNFFCHRSKILDQDTAQEWIEYLEPHFRKFDASAPHELKNIYPSFKDSDDYLNLVLETCPAAVSFHFGIPHPHQIEALKKAKILTMVSATNLAEAKAIAEAGIDVIIAQGVEAGGHRGCFNPHRDSAIKTTDLVRLILQYLDLPVVAAGGIMNGRQAQQCLALGAQAVQLGTAFVQCPSSNANAAYREALFNRPLTQITSTISGRPARGLINAWHTEVDLVQRPSLPAYPYVYDIAKQLHQIASKQGHYEYGAFWAGSNVAQIRQLNAVDLINLLNLEINQATHSNLD